MNTATAEFIERKSSILSPDAVRDQFIEDKKDEVYFSKETILEHASDCTESGQFILDVMTAYFEYMESPAIPLSVMDFASKITGLCQQLRNDTTDYVVRNA
jgi:hypothetical protein